MRTVAPALQTRLSAQAKSLAWIVEITRRDTTVVRLNSAGTNLTYGGDSYDGKPGFELTSIQFRGDGGDSSVDLHIPITDSTPIVWADVQAGLYDNAAATLSILDHEDIAAGALAVYSGNIGRIVFADSIRAEFEIQSRWARAKDFIASVYGPTCRWRFGDTNCGVDVEGLFTDSCTVTAVTSRYEFTISGPSPLRAENYYALGAAKFTSGNNLNLRSCDVRSNTDAGVIKLWIPAVKDIQVGDTVDIHKGCQLNHTACLEHNNQDQFGGFRFSPEKLELAITSQVRAPTVAAPEAEDDDGDRPMLVYRP